jgi:hypothetical protein
VACKLLNFSVGEGAGEGLLPDLARCIEHVNRSDRTAKPSFPSQQYAYPDLPLARPEERAVVKARPGDGLASHRDFT